MQKPEPVRLTVSEIRARAGGPAGETPGLGARGQLLGSIFHRTAQGLLAADSPASWQAVLSGDSLEDAERLQEHVYDRLLGPELSRREAALQECSEGALMLWEAARALCEWLAKTLAAARDSGVLRYDGRLMEWRGLEGLIETERELAWDLREPGWTAPVRVEGRADAVWRRPADRAWCVAEYKLGAGRPEADLLQACLYRAMLAGEESSPDASLVLLRFTPRAEEAFFPPEKLRSAESALRRMIGELARVVPGAEPRPPEPPVDRPPVESPDEQHRKTGRELCAHLAEFKCAAEFDGDPVVGPTFVRYFLRPWQGYPPRRFFSQDVNLHVRMGLSAPPFIHVDRGRLAVDVQRKDRRTLWFREVRGRLPARTGYGCSQLLAGVDLEGNPRFADFNEPTNAHVLVAGTAGGGKSEWMRAALASLALTNTPETLRLALIDPKRSAFNELADSPYLLDGLPIVHPPEDSVIELLEKLIAEMEDRYRLFAEAGADNLPEFNRKSSEKKPRIVAACDEYFDLIEGDRKTRQKIESCISRLGAKARAAGINLILATQQPSREVVTGRLKANMTCRVALKTNSSIESGMILERKGAEKLLGRGDLLFADIGEPVRLQAPLLSEQERASIFREAEKASGSTA